MLTVTPVTPLTAKAKPMPMTTSGTTSAEQESLVIGILDTQMSPTAISRNAKPDLQGAAAEVRVHGPDDTGETVLQDIGWCTEDLNEATTWLTNWLTGPRSA